jgi:hypothetical protein
MFIININFEEIYFDTRYIYNLFYERHDNLIKLLNKYNISYVVTLL